MKNSLQSYFTREQVIKVIRNFFDQQGFHEIICPILNPSVPMEPTIYPFRSTWNTLNNDRDVYLPTSPEGAMKRIIAAGVGNCYTVGKCFRNLENSGERHNPEFLMLEWYRQDENYHQIMKDTQQLIREVKHGVDEFVAKKRSNVLNYQHIKIDLGGNWPVLSLDDLFKKYLGVRIADILELKQIKKLALAKAYSIETKTESVENEWEQLFNQLLVNEIEPKLPTNQAFFLVDFPSRLSPLCGIQEDQPHLAERFEVYIAGMEIGNGMNEQLDSSVLKKFYQQEKKYRSDQKQKFPPPYHCFYQALDKIKASGHNFSGMGLGVDRLAMLMANVEKIKQVEFFTIN